MSHRIRHKFNLRLVQPIQAAARQGLAFPAGRGWRRSSGVAAMSPGRCAIRARSKATERTTVTGERPPPAPCSGLPDSGRLASCRLSLAERRPGHWYELLPRRFRNVAPDSTQIQPPAGTTDPGSGPAGPRVPGRSWAGAGVVAYRRGLRAASATPSGRGARQRKRTTVTQANDHHQRLAAGCRIAGDLRLAACPLRNAGLDTGTSYYRAGFGMSHQIQRQFNPATGTTEPGRITGDLRFAACPLRNADPALVRVTTLPVSECRIQFNRTSTVGWYNRSRQRPRQGLAFPAGRGRRRNSGVAARSPSRCATPSGRGARSTERTTVTRRTTTTNALQRAAG